MKSTVIRVIIGVVLVGCGVAGIYYLRGVQDRQDNLAPDRQETVRVVREVTSQPASAPATSQSSVDAEADFAGGMIANEQHKFLEARERLSRAYFSGGLSPSAELVARDTLQALAAQTILSSQAVDGDPYTFYYTVQPGETLKGVSGIERKQGLHVPAEMILKINGFEKGALVPAGRKIKLIRGPFHAVVDKTHFTMDVYLQREGLPKVFIKRYSVGLGKDGCTPEGAWRVRLSKPALEGQPPVTGKQVKATWNPPPNSTQGLTAVAWGQEGYPLGKEGYWISLEGIDADTEDMVTYGIHGTNEPDSIGREGSLGCIRMRDADIEEVFWMLYEKWSTVTTQK